MRWVPKPLATAMLVGLLMSAACDGGPQPVPSYGNLAWKALASAPSERTEVAATALDGRIYVAGGYRADGGTLATVEIFDTATGRWTGGPDLPVPVNHAMAVTAGDSVYVLGGYDSSGKAFAGAFRLDGGAWRSVSPLPEPRAAGTAAVVGGKVYVAGGIGSGGALAGTMLVYDVAGDRWSTAPGPPTPREHLGGAGFDGHLYTVGGRTGAGNLAAFEDFTVATGQWSSRPALPTARGGLAAAPTCDGRIIAVGGEAQSTFAEAEVFDTKSGSWRALPALPTPRHGLGVVSVGTTLYTLAGGPRPGLHVSGVLEAIDLASLGACPTPSV